MLDRQNCFTTALTYEIEWESALGPFILPLATRMNLGLPTATNSQPGGWRLNQPLYTGWINYLSFEHCPSKANKHLLEERNAQWVVGTIYNNPLYRRPGSII